jgi:hypothetical protein
MVKTIKAYKTCKFKIIYQRECKSKFKTTKVEN